MLMEVAVAPAIGAGASVIGMNTTLDAGDAPAFCDTHTPPPVVPTYTRLPVESEGSKEMEETRPDTNP
jgi:hypothetical protein